MSRGGWMRERSVGGWRLVPILAALVSTSCGEPPPRFVVDEGSTCIEDFEPGTDYYPEKIRFEEAERIRVAYHDHYKVVEVRTDSSEWGPDVVDRLVLVRCGTPTPTLEGELRGATVVEVPVRRAASNEDQTAARLALLGFAPRIVALGSPGVYTSELRALVDSGAVAIGASYHGVPDLEAVLAAEADVLFQFTSSLEHLEHLERARRLGIAAVPTLAWSEPSPLGQAEWLKHAALFVDAEAEANALYDRIRNRYRILVDAVAGRPDTPTVVWAGPLASGRWWVEAGSWSATLVRAAGGRLPWEASPGETSITLSTEALLEGARGADVWITSHANLPERLGDPGIRTLPPVVTDRVYHVHRRAIPEADAYDWYESAVVRPDLVLEDLVALLHPDVRPDHEFRYLATFDQVDPRVGGAP